MKKIKTVFVIDRSTHRATDEVYAEWVMNGEGTATIKFDGTSCMIRDNKLFKRFDAKHGKPTPDGWEPCEAERDPVTGHWPGWVPVDVNDPSSKWHLEAFKGRFEDGTYELVGPKIQGNRYNLDSHELWKHGSVTVRVTRTREDLLEWLINNHHEGLVFHRHDGEMVKLRRKDFGIPW
jgi:hypothetical protein